MMQSLMQRILFFSKFMSSPRTIGSITPSSKYLVNSLLKPVNWDQTKTVLELGAGTGVVTREIANRVNHSCRVITFELDPELRRYLKNQFPRFVHCCDARNLKQELRLQGMNEADCVVSSLPFANFSKQDCLKILDEIIQKVLSCNGVFVAYQYSLHMLPMLRSCFGKVEVRFVPANLPPGFVYVCSK